MARFGRLETLQKMKELGLVTIFSHSDSEVATNVVSACLDGGASIIEFTNRSVGSVRVFEELLRHGEREKIPATLGAGSIVDGETAALFINTGADFIVGPVFDAGVARLCNKRKIPYLPGCGSASEIHTAHEWGVEICKIFPGKEVGGPSFVKAIRGPMPWVEVMPTGGVEPTEESLRAWFDAGAVCVGMGSKLITGEMVERKDYNGITEQCKKIVEMIRRVKPR
jgi:2-dehydro-3-deoxyphosphogluconate aldolase/(4S)-4-hydroxy-2-oxoglutarate aldolase